MKQFIIAILLTTIMSGANAAKTETWECTTFSSNTPVVFATIESDGSGTVSSMGVNFDVDYIEKSGFEVRWDYGRLTDVGSHSYSLVIGIEGYGRVYDFRDAGKGEGVKPAHVFKCELAK